MNKINPQENVTIVIDPDLKTRNAFQPESWFLCIQAAGNVLAEQFAQFGLPGVVYLQSLTTLRWEPDATMRDDVQTQIRAASRLLKVQPTEANVTTALTKLFADLSLSTIHFPT